MFSDPWIAGLVALFLWWFSTGMILVVVTLVDRFGGRAGRLVTWGAFPLVPLGLWVLWSTRDLLTAGGIYHAFLGAIAVWAWIELAFLTGTITGPNHEHCQDDTRGWDRFWHAWRTIAYHEVLLVVILAVLMIALQQASNPFGAWTFALLFVARVSAKLNLFLGVPKINTEFLPQALAHLPSHFRYRRMNALFPISIGLLLVAIAICIRQIGMSGAADLGFALLASMAGLALLEHLFMVLSLPDEKLWRWMLPTPKPTHRIKTRTEDAHGL